MAAETVYVFFTDSYDGHSSHELLSEVMLRYVGRADFELRRKAGGKPYFAEEAAPHFSISHSGSIWLCAVASREVGADVQLHKSMPRYKNIVKRYFHADEAELLERSACPEDAFFDVWSKKEAIAKLHGCGIDASFKHIDTADQCELAREICLPIVALHSAAVACDVDFDITISKL